jgi:ribosome biogenesis protein Nip4
MIKPIEDFARLLNSNISLDQNLIVKSQDRYFLLNKALKHLASKDFFHAGIYLGKQRDRVFFPSFNLLAMIAKKGANEVIVDGKTEWLFICGRDIFKRGITRVAGSAKKGSYTLVLNSHGECLGFGEILCNLSEARRDVVVKNDLDIGDFLRREKSSLRTRS